VGVMGAVAFYCTLADVASTRDQLRGQGRLRGDRAADAGVGVGMGSSNTPRRARTPLPLEWAKSDAASWHSCGLSASTVGSSSVLDHPSPICDDAGPMSIKRRFLSGAGVYDSSTSAPFIPLLCFAEGEIVSSTR
jgi:hypothetical protein